MEFTPGADHPPEGFGPHDGHGSRPSLDLSSAGTKGPSMALSTEVDKGADVVYERDEPREERVAFGGGSLPSNDPNFSPNGPPKDFPRVEWGGSQDLPSVREQLTRDWQAQQAAANVAVISEVGQQATEADTASEEQINEGTEDGGDALPDPQNDKMLIVDPGLNGKQDNQDVTVQDEGDLPGNASDGDAEADQTEVADGTLQGEPLAVETETDDEVPNTASALEILGSEIALDSQDAKSDIDELDETDQAATIEAAEAPAVRDDDASSETEVDQTDEQPPADPTAEPADAELIAADELTIPQDLEEQIVEDGETVLEGELLDIDGDPATEAEVIETADPARNNAELAVIENGTADDPGISGDNVEAIAENDTASGDTEVIQGNEITDSDGRTWRFDEGKGSWILIERESNDEPQDTPEPPNGGTEGLSDDKIAELQEALERLLGREPKQGAEVLAAEEFESMEAFFEKLREVAEQIDQPEAPDIPTSPSDKLEWLDGHTRGGLIDAVVEGYENPDAKKLVAEHLSALSGDELKEMFETGVEVLLGHGNTHPGPEVQWADGDEQGPPVYPEQFATPQSLEPHERPEPFQPTMPETSQTRPPTQGPEPEPLKYSDWLKHVNPAIRVTKGEQALAAVGVAGGVVRALFRTAAKHTENVTPLGDSWYRVAVKISWGLTSRVVYKNVEARNPASAAAKAYRNALWSS